MTQHKRDLTAEQAAAIIDKVKAELPGVWLGGRQRMVLEQVIADALKTTRRAALLEAIKCLDDTAHEGRPDVGYVALTKLAQEG